MVSPAGAGGWRARAQLPSRNAARQKGFSRPGPVPAAPCVYVARLPPGVVARRRAWRFRCLRPGTAPRRSCARCIRALPSGNPGRRTAGTSVLVPGPLPAEFPVAVLRAALAHGNDELALSQPARSSHFFRRFKNHRGIPGAYGVSQIAVHPPDPQPAGAAPPQVDQNGEVGERQQGQHHAVHTVHPRITAGSSRRR